MDFGLGLILSFTDNATSGINSAVTSLGQLTQAAENADTSLNKMASLSALSVVSGQLGSSFTNAGGAILSTLGQVIGKVNETGQTLMYAENQLDALYANSGKTGEQVIAQIQQYAKTSMFEFENLIPAVTSLKSVGIEAFDAITSSTGNAQHSLLDYASALASFAPQMKNAYGTGINAAIGAMREYIAEGNEMSLKRGAGLDITGILGEDKGATIEERTRQVADLIETLGMMPMVEAMSNSPMTKLSNMGDTLFQFAGMVANSGVYEEVSKLISIFADFVGSLDNEKLQNIATSFGSALSSLIKPIEWLAEKIVVLADGFFNLLESNPQIAEFVTIGSALAGVLLVLVGVALKITSAFSGLSLMLLTTGNSFSSIGSLFSSGILKITTTLLPLMAVMGALGFAWKNDIGGIKTTVTDFVSNLSSSFKTAKEAVSGSVEDLSTTLENLRNKGDFFSNLTIGIMEVMVLFQALSELWNGYTLSGDTFLKAKELGILPLIKAILDLKYRFEFFKQGFIDGWNEIAEKVKSALSGLMDKIDGTLLGDIVDGLTKVFKTLSSTDPKEWENAGNIFSKISAGLISLWGALKLFKGVSSIFSGGKSIGSTIAGLLGIGGKKSGSSIGGSTGGFLSNPTQVLKNMSSIAIIVGGVSLLLTALGALTSIPYFDDFISGGADTIVLLFDNLVPIAGSIGALGLLVKAFDLMKISPTTALKGIADFAIILGGLELIMVALGAITSIPYFSDFISKGSTVINQIADVLENMFSVKVIGSIALIAAFGLVPVSTVLLGIANLALVLAGLTALVVAFGALSKVEGFNEFIETGGEILSLLFTQLGKVVGSFVGGIGEGITDSLPAMGDNLSAFAENLQPFLEIVSGAPIDSIGEFASALGSFMLKLAGQELLSAITGDIDLVALGKNLSDFATNASGFFTTVASYPEEGFSKAKSVFETLSGMSDYSFKTGGLAQVFTGTTDLTTIGTQLASFAPNGATFFNTVADYSASGISKAKSVFEALAGIGDYDFKTGGLAQLFTGSTNLKKIGEQLTDFGESAKGFFDTASQISETGVTNGAKMLDVLSDLKDFKTGGLVELFTGELDLETMGSKLSIFATNVKTFFDTVALIDPTTYTNATKMFTSLKSVSSLVDIASKSDGDLANFGVELSSFGANVVTFIDTISNLGDSSTAVTNLNTVITSFSNAFDIARSEIELNSTAITTATTNMVTTLSTNLDNLSIKVDNIVTSISEDLNALSSKFSNLKLQLPDIKVPHFSIQGDFNIETKEVPQITVSWYEKGGLFDSPSIIGVGENGKEAVVPLENNLGWIKGLASMIVTEMAGNLVPTNTAMTTNNNNQGDNNQKYLTSNSTANTTYEGDTDNSIVFNAGAIQVNVQNASDEEAYRLAKKIIEYISRQKELDRMMSYA